MKARFFIALAALAAAPAFAQLASPNAAGVAIGHIHINATDMDAQENFWTEVGGKIVHREKMVMAQFPGIDILLRKQANTGGTAGSVLNHFGFYVKNFDESVARWKAAGLQWEPGKNPGQGFLTGPDAIRVEIYENKNIPTPVQMHHIHLFVTDPAAAQKWYVENFGATAGKRGQYDTANVPGAELTLAKSDKALAPTKGRSVDHIGFEVRNIDAFMAKLQAAGIQAAGPIRNSPNASGLRICFITDPWGTQIEITEGLASPPQTSSR